MRRNTVDLMDAFEDLKKYYHDISLEEIIEIRAETRAELLFEEKIRSMAQDIVNQKILQAVDSGLGHNVVAQAYGITMSELNNLLKGRN